MPPGKPGYQDKFLTSMEQFFEVSRGQPYLLPAEEQAAVGLAPETWWLEITGDAHRAEALDPVESPTGEVEIQPSQIEKPLRREDGTALDYKTLLELGREHAVRYFKAMQCNNDRPNGGLCSNALWEGVPLREVLKLVGKISNVRRVYYWGFHQEPRNYFASSLAINRVLDTPPGMLPVFVAYKMNGRPIPVERGGPVRMIVPEAYGFKSIKWVQHIVLTNDHRANDVYATRNNDPDSYMKTVARIDLHGAREFEAGAAVRLNGIAMVGQSGLSRVEYWLRPDQGTHGKLDADDPAWAKADWKEVPFAAAPGAAGPADWGGDLPDGKLPEGVLHIDPATGRPRIWPLPYSWVLWSVTLRDLAPGTYEFYVRAVDANGYAQPEPRPNRQSGYADIAGVQITVKG